MTRRDEVGLKVFRRLCERWGITSIDEQAILLGVSNTTLEGWYVKTPAGLDRDKLERISYLLGIYEGLHVFLEIGNLPTNGCAV